MTKRILCVISALAFLLCFAACAGNTDIPESSVEESSEVVVPPTMYTIVYSKAYGTLASSIADAVKEASGLEFECVQFGGAIPENAVVVGDVADGVGNVLSKGINDKDYGIKKENDRIYLYSGNKSSMSDCIEYFCKNYISEKGIDGDKVTDHFYDHAYPLENYTVNGVSLGEFRIVWTDTKNEAKYSDVASDLKSYLKDEGAFKIMSSNGQNETEYELILGAFAGRDITKDEKENKYAYNAYKITVSGNKIAVVGNNAVAVWHGCMALLEGAENGNITDKVVEGSCDIVKVSCVGDSITEGGNSTDPYSMTYPVYLQKMLGYDYLVKNHGHSGYSVVFTDEYSYTKSDRYMLAKAFAPDVVIYMLGTNDCNPGQAYKSWDDGKREARYIEDTGRYFDAFIKANENVQIFVCIPPTLCYSTVWPWEEWAKRITEHTMILNRQIAEERGYPIVDMYSWSVEHPEVFPDGLHPKDGTYKDYAQRVYDEIIGVIKTPENITK